MGWPEETSLRRCHLNGDPKDEQEPGVQRERERTFQAREIVSAKALR